MSSEEKKEKEDVGSEEGRIWSGITQYLTSIEVARLYCTGNRRLRVVLEKRGGITELVHEVRVEQEAKRTEITMKSKIQCWPRFLLVRFRNSLRSFVIVGVPDSAFVETDPPMALNDIQCLPAGLTRLVVPLHIKMTNEIVNALPANLVSLELGREYSMPNWVISSLPSSMKRMEVRKHRNFGDSIASQLPSALTYLSLPHNIELTGEFLRKTQDLPLVHLDLARNAKINSSHFAFLPRSLLHLNLASLTKMRAQDVAMLPPNLTWLELTSVVGVDSEEGFFHLLPRSLLTFNAESASLFSPSQLSHLPPLLTNLSLGITDQLASVGLHVLPKSLTRLALDSASSLGSLLLPFPLPNLLYLSLPLINDFTDSNIHFLPPSLTILNLLNASKLTEKALPLLPPRLRFVSLSVSSPFGFNAWKLLPPSISMPVPLPFEALRGAASHEIETLLRQAFSACGRPYERHIRYQPQPESNVASQSTGNEVAIGPEEEKQWSDRFKKLFEGQSPPAVVRFDTWIQEVMTRDTLLELPQGMEYLDVTMASNLKSPYAKNLPRGLRELYLPVTSPFYSKEFIDLPRGLETLLLGDAHYTRVAAREVVSLRSLLAGAATCFRNSLLPRKTTCTVHSMHFGALPRCLKHLLLQTWVKCRDDDLKLLPPHLLTLVLSPETSLSPLSLAYLPRSITHLDLSTNPHITNASISDLPPSLTFLNLARASSLSDPCVAFLPPSLRTFIATKSKNWTSKGMARLPRGLTYLNWDSAIHLSDEGIASLPSTLTHLSLRHSYLLSNACISLLPRNLQYFIATYNEQFTAACLSSLPPAIARFECLITLRYDTISQELGTVKRKVYPMKRAADAHAQLSRLAPSNPSKSRHSTSTTLANQNHHEHIPIQRPAGQHPSSQVASK